jgi:hypothetical protein
VTHLVHINGRTVILEVRHNGFVWTAVDDDTYAPGCPVGFGDTPHNAVNEWMREQLQRVAA